MKNADNFQTEKFSLRVLLSICLIFRLFQPGIAYKGVAYKKRVFRRCSLLCPKSSIKIKIIL